MRVLKRFVNYTIKLSANEIKGTDYGARICSAVLSVLILKYGFAPIKSSELSRKGPHMSLTVHNLLQSCLEHEKMKHHFLEYL